MKISKDECEKDFAKKNLILSDKKCNNCEYYKRCPFIARSFDDVINGDDGY